MGSGIPMDLSEVAFKCNFAHLNPQTGIVEKLIFQEMTNLTC